jgi:hypothetical protein
MTHSTDSDHDRRIAPMFCVFCGARMNPHAEKAVVPDGDAEGGRVDWALGGLIEEIHQCPRCANVQSRRATE